MDLRGDLIQGEIISLFIESRASLHAASVHAKTSALESCVGFIDGTVIGIARPCDSDQQNVAYNGHKRKHALKFQAVSTPDGLFLHTFGPIEGRRHDWTLYMQSGIEEQLEKVLQIEGKQFCIYRDSGYNARPYMDVPFQGSSLTTEKSAFNKSMSSARISVEWMFKEVKLYWSHVDFKRQMRVGQSPVGLLYNACMLLTNFRNCLYPNATSQYFRCAPPDIDSYVMHKQ